MIKSLFWLRVREVSVHGQLALMPLDLWKSNMSWWKMCANGHYLVYNGREGKQEYEEESETLFPRSASNK